MSTGGSFTIDASFVMAGHERSARKRKNASSASPRRRRGPFAWSRTRPRLRAARTACGPCPCRRPRPGAIWCPRWRTMMLPARTLWPPDFFTPSRRPAESRPLRDEPPAFLCAMIRFLTSSASARASCQSWRLGFARGWLPAPAWPWPSWRQAWSLRLGLLLGLFRLRLGGQLRRLLAVGQDLGDAERGELLAMALLATIIRAPLLLEDDDFVGAASAR